MTLLTTAFAQGTHAARPAAASSNTGFYYFETDTGTLFQSTGSAWTQLAPTVSSGTAPTSTIITASGTYTTPTGCLAILVECIGAGGGGGGTPATASSGNGQVAAAAGGGGGAYSASLIGSPSASYTATIGAGGSGGIGNNNGSAGGNTSLGTAVVAEGGQGGAKGTPDIGTIPDTSAAATRGGLASNGTGNFKLDGGNGEGGMFYATYMPVSGGGGDAARGAGRRTGSAGTTFSGNAGRQYGGGGTGAGGITGATAQNGGAGAAGVIVVTEYY